MLQMKQQLKEEQAKSKQKADEIAELRRYVCYEQQDSDNCYNNECTGVQNYMHA